MSARPGAVAAFTISVVGGATSAVSGRAVVTESSCTANGVTPEAGGGTQHLQIATDPACRWAVKVTSA